MRTPEETKALLIDLAQEVESGSRLLPGEKSFVGSFFHSCDRKMMWGGDSSPYVCLARYIDYRNRGVEHRLAGNIEEALEWESLADDDFDKLPQDFRW